MSRNPRRGNTGIKIILILLILLLIGATALVVWLCIDLVNNSAAQAPTQDTTLTLPVSTRPTETETQPPETTLPEPETVVSTATIGAMGDLLMHEPIFRHAAQGDGSYDFEFIFRYLKEYTEKLDYAAANLETTLCGTDNGYSYSGYPHFNCPDGIVDSARDAGFDMLLTANNHSYDTTLVGYKRTLEVVREKGLATLGTMLTPEEDKYSIVDVNGIRIGMVCYTYASYVTSDGRPSLNDNAPVSEAGITNYFTYQDLERFYNELSGYLSDMEQAGAEATVLYIHWGTEYQVEESEIQNTMAQKLCDLGIDVIIGGHPHVVQPMELLTSTADPNHKTICIYSLGNAVSNQRREHMNLNTGHTEDGVLFTVTFEKYSDGKVYLAGTDVLPTWVNLSSVNGKTEYNILPLDNDRREEWQTLFNLTDSLYQKTLESYDRTQAIVGDGLTQCQNWLTQAKEEREAYYYDLAMNPDKYPQETAGEPLSETAGETSPETTGEDAAA